MLDGIDHSPSILSYEIFTLPFHSILDCNETLWSIVPRHSQASNAVCIRKLRRCGHESIELTSICFNQFSVSKALSVHGPILWMPDWTSPFLQDLLPVSLWCRKPLFSSRTHRVSFHRSISCLMLRFCRLHIAGKSAYFNSLRKDTDQYMGPVLLNEKYLLAPA